MSIFGGDTGITYEQLQQRKKMVDAYRQPMQPRNVGEGIHAIAKALVARGVDKQNASAESKLKGEADAVWQGLFAGSPSMSTMGTASPGSATPPPVVARTESDVLADDTMTALGKKPMGQYADAIASIESAGSGDYAAIGPTHPKLGRALGRYQVMEANIGPWSREVLGREVTPDEFMANPRIQDAIFNGKFGGYVDQYGPEGAAQAWFGGPGGVGRLSTKDSLGTSIGEYSNKFTSAIGGAPSGQPSGGQPGVQAIVQALSNPMIQNDPGKMMVLQALLGQAMERPDPMDAIELERAQIELDQMRNPQPGFSILTDEEEQALGLPVDGSYQRGRDGKISAIGGGGTRVDIRNEGTIPQGYRAVRDEAGNLISYEPVAGGPEDTTVFDERKLQSAMTASDVVTTAATRAREAASQQDLGSAGTSLVGKLPWTDSAEVLRQVEVLKAQAAAGNLQAMRDQSPTGGALGNVTERELDLLANKSGALNPNSPNFLRDLEDYERTLLRTIHGREAGDAIFDATRGGTTDDGWTVIDGVKIRVKQ